MLADFFTKPLQGQLFRKFKAVLLGHAHVDTLAASTMAPVEERVGNVGNVRPSSHGNAATGAIGTGAVGIVLGVDIGTSTDHNNIAVHAAQGRTVSWADVVRGSTVVRTTLGTATKDTNGSKGQQVTKRSRFVSRSFSRNNPVNGV